MEFWFHMAGTPLHKSVHHSHPQELGFNSAAFVPANGVSTAATKWAATDEMACEAADVQPIIEGLVRLAKIASSQNRKLYFWNCT